MGRYIWNVTIKYLTRVVFEKQLTALHVFHTFYLFLTDMCSLCWQTCGPGPKLFPRLDIYRGAKSAQTLYNTLKTHTKYAHIVRGRPTLKDVERFRNGSVYEPYERSLYERTFMSEPFIEKHAISTELSNVRREKHSFCMKMRPEASNKQSLLPWQQECCHLQKGHFCASPLSS